ncbi:putative bifunctional diguanylate cyclase/phosphodiesterase [Roseateles saccharophilus]|uniref:Diguanylate cyclase (GGDEF)-like protein n=1 Tax=Roseateles saccharophilus TaxID=304 RepID=A0A4R3ULF6_ROSSA|nr:EAL domain-containing protein [Roseateles saccharophilus]MDG0833502.1 bifunctional diguanylate cyclase/phosphodiesterase [Roseateles saccharophilus]TCU92525.1 diguanylate cyclase (GGDEF)-like protein [Roseateles saccharophilus]
MSYLKASYDPWLVVLSVFIASFASYVALNLARRVGEPDRRAAKAWWVGGSVVMGTGIWSMHFVGMLAFSLPIAIGYTALLTFTSWIAAVVVSGIALGIAGRGALTGGRLVQGAVAMGAGICAMHYSGMAAIDMEPGIAWDPGWVLVSVAIAVGASATALVIFFKLARLDGFRGAMVQGLSAVVMGLAISGMHYTAMAAARVPLDAVCSSAGALSGSRLETLVVMVALAMLACTWIVLSLDARTQRKTLVLAKSLRLSNEQLARANEELRRRTFVDPLTDLPNRKLFEDRLAHAVAIHKRLDDRPGERAHGTLAVLFIDLDGFKPVNDSFGHGAGDLVLTEVARRLGQSARAGDTVARVGGDEFLLLMEDVGTVADCTALAARLCEALRAPIKLGGQAIEISASIGIAAAPGHGERDRLIAHADAAMYAAKRAGGNGYTLFESRMDADAHAQLSLQAELRHAAERGELMLYYQPKIAGRGGQIHSVEALLRWRHPRRGLIGPAEFIPLAERFGFIAQVGQWVVEETCRQMHEWSAQGVHIRVAINLSAQQLRDADLAGKIGRAIRCYDIAPDRLLCEITESAAMEDVESTQRVFDGLARIGIFLSIDDFGTGFSSLGYLRRLPAKQLKIDRSFVQDLETSPDARAIVDAVVQLAHALGLKVVAEGVETEAQRAILVALGSDELQGYLFARPMPAMDLLDWMLDRTPVGDIDFAPSVIDA